MNKKNTITDKYYEMTNNDDDYYNNIKLALVGDSSVGKSSIMNKFTDDFFTNESIPTIGVDYKIRNIFRNSKHYKIQIWDTAGQERFRTITSSYYRSVVGIIIVFDIGNIDTFENVKMWISECKKYNSDAEIFLVGNKSELPNYLRKISKDNAEKYAKTIGCDYIEVSAKTGFNIDELFFKTIDQIIKKNPLKKEKSVKLQKYNTQTNPPTSNKKYCCN